jgi:hypothetical protein
MTCIKWLLLIAPAVALGCGKTTTVTTTASSSATTGSGGAGGEEMGVGGEPSWIVASGSGGCDTTLYEVPIQKSPHVEECSVLDHISNPPTSGPHYPRWASFQSYDEPIPRGYLVHALEHGAVMLAYDCPQGCDAEVMAMQAFVDGLEPDPACIAPVVNRLIIVPDPALDVPFAAAAWGHMLKAQCFDEELVAAFVEAHYASGPENVCGQGFDPSDPLERVPPDCGQ